MNREQWRDLQRALHPKDLESVQLFADALIREHAFVFAYDGQRSISLEGPAVQHLAREMIADVSGRRSPDDQAPAAHLRVQ